MQRGRRARPQSPGTNFFYQRHPCRWPPAKPSPSRRRRRPCAAGAAAVFVEHRRSCPELGGPRRLAASQAGGVHHAARPRQQFPAHRRRRLCALRPVSCCRWTQAEKTTELPRLPRASPPRAARTRRSTSGCKPKPTASCATRRSSESMAAAGAPQCRERGHQTVLARHARVLGNPRPV